LYLGPPSQLPGILSILPDYAELEPYRVLLQSLVSKKADDLVLFCGPTVSAFTQIWKQLYPEEIASLMIGNTERYAAFESSGVMALSGVVSPEVLSLLPVESRHEELFLKFCIESTARSRELTDLSYIDEIRTLQIGGEKGFGESVLASKFDDLEFEYLDAFALPGSGSY
jgi:hypothetical protein